SQGLTMRPRYFSVNLHTERLGDSFCAADVSDVDGIDCGRDTAGCGNPSDGGLWNHPRAPFGFPKGRAYQLLLQNVARGLAGDTEQPRAMRRHALNRITHRTERPQRSRIDTERHRLAAAQPAAECAQS